MSADRERAMFGTLRAEIDEALMPMSPRERLRYAQSTLSNAQEEMRLGGEDGADVARQLMNVAKYAIETVIEEMPR